MVRFPWVDRNLPSQVDILSGDQEPNTYGLSPTSCLPDPSDKYEVLSVQPLAPLLICPLRPDSTWGRRQELGV